MTQTERVGGATAQLPAAGVLRPASMRTAIRSLRRLPVFSVSILVLVLLCGLLAPWLAPHDPEKGVLADAFIPPFWEAEGRATYPLGTDNLGRDILSRVIFGARVSLLVAVTVVILSGAAGIAIALVAGYLGGWVDAVLMRLTDAVLSLPFILLAVTAAAFLGSGLKNIILILAVFGWTNYARVLRGEVLTLKESDFVRLARVTGCGPLRIMGVHLFPNIVNSFVVLATLALGRTVIAEASLSFLGLGVNPPTPSWGSMLATGRGYLSSGWWMSVFPGIALALTVLAVNLLGDWLRDALDPRQRQV